ncbi:MAG: hypothetical protein ACJ8AF_07250 [Gemmatimonadaceae bacterium]
MTGPLSSVERPARPRMPSLIVVGAIFLILGALDIWRGIAPLFTSGHMATDDAEVLAIGIAAIVGGIGVLRGMNWARWLLAVWATFHVAISVGQPKQFVAHLVIFGGIVYLLFRRRASGYFVR